MLSGLWHGAAWVWLIWGTALGVVLVAERNVVRLLGARRRGDPTRTAALGAAIKATDGAIQEALGAR